MGETKRAQALSYTIAIIFSIVCLLVTGMASTMAGPDPEPKPAPPPRSLVYLTDAEAVQLPPVKQEIRSVQLREREQLAELTAALEAAWDDTEALRLQRRITDVKQQAEIDIMEVQARHAAAAGRQEQAETIRAAIAGMKERLAERAIDSEGGQ